MRASHGPSHCNCCACTHEVVHLAALNALFIPCSIAGGLAWLGFLAVGALGEQVKTRWEVAHEEAGKRDVSHTLRH